MMSALGHVMPLLARAHARAPARGCAPRRARGAPARAASSDADGARPTAPSEGDDAPADITKDELIRTSTAVRLSSHVYKTGDLEPWIAKDGFVLRAQGVTPCTRWFVCDKLEPAPAGDDAEEPSTSESTSESSTESSTSSASSTTSTPSRVTQRWVIVRGAAWNDELVDRVKLSTQIARAWPAPLHPGVPVVCHAGVAEMTDAFWPEVAPLLESLPPTASLCCAGHSLGGSMATLLMAWSALRLGVHPTRMEPARTFGSPPVLAADGWAARVEGAGMSAERVARAAAKGGDWVGEIMTAVGMRQGVGGVGIGDGGMGTGTGGTDAASSAASSARSKERDALRLAGFAPDAVRAFVLSNDPVPRMWLAADPLFGAAAANETIKAVLGARSRLFGDGILSERRFLYEAVGTLYWLTWSAADGTRLTVHDGGADAMVEKLRMTPPWETGAVGAVAGAWDHNAQNYVDAVQYLALKRLVNAKSKSL